MKKPRAHERTPATQIESVKKLLSHVELEKDSDGNISVCVCVCWLSTGNVHVSSIKMYIIEQFFLLLLFSPNVLAITLISDYVVSQILIER